VQLDDLASDVRVLRQAKQHSLRRDRVRAQYRASSTSSTVLVVLLVLVVPVVPVVLVVLVVLAVLVILVPLGGIRLARICNLIQNAVDTLRNTFESV
jgi:Flp pilus assembly protein TadB